MEVVREVPVDRVVEREKIVVRVVEGEAPGDESGEKARLLALAASRAGNENSTTSTRAYSRGLRVSLCERNPPRVIDPSTHPPNRLRRDRAREV